MALTILTLSILLLGFVIVPWMVGDEERYVIRESEDRVLHVTSTPSNLVFTAETDQFKTFKSLYAANKFIRKSQREDSLETIPLDEATEVDLDPLYICQSALEIDRYITEHNLEDQRDDIIYTLVQDAVDGDEPEHLELNDDEYDAMLLDLLLCVNKHLKNRSGIIDDDEYR